MIGDGSEDGRGTGSGPATDGDLSARLKRLDAGIDRKRASAPDRTPRSAAPTETTALAKGVRMSAEFMAGVIVGGGLGWAFDHYLGTKPWGLIVFLMLGFGAGIYNVMRVSGFTDGASSR